MSDLAAAHAALCSVFGFENFRSGQDAIVETVLGRRRAHIMPTDSGHAFRQSVRDGVNHIVVVVDG